MKLAMLLALAALACGCHPLPPPDGCAPMATRCSPAGIPQVCSPERRWTGLPLAMACHEIRPPAVCCLTTSVYSGRPPIHACVPATACIPEVVDAGTAEGGAL